MAGASETSWTGEWTLIREKSASNATLAAASPHPTERLRIAVAASSSTLSSTRFAPDLPDAGCVADRRAETLQEGRHARTGTALAVE
jgi:hypothetical protein